MFTENSKIARFIAEHPSNWKELIEEKFITVKQTGDRYIFNYQSIFCDYNDPVVQEARGIILEIKDGNAIVVCWPFRKFGNYQEGYVDHIDWASARVQEKVDGSIMKLYHYNGQWIWATNSCVEAREATLYGKFETFEELVRKATNYKNIPFAKLNKDWTYIFEITSLENKVVIEYKETSLYHLGTRNNLTGEEYVVDIGMKKPKEFALSSLEECIEAAAMINKGKTDIENEGFVVVDKDFHRVKVKSPEYVLMHHAQGSQLSKKEMLEALLLDRELEKVREGGAYEVPYLYYKFNLAEYLSDADMFARYVRQLYEEFEHDRKAVAMQIKGHPMANIGFAAIGNEMTAKEIVSKISTRIENGVKVVTPSYLDSRITDYQHDFLAF